MSAPAETKTAPLYCESLTTYKRFPTREVDIGGVPVGGNNPIRIQSMTTADTMDTEATVAETACLIEAGCDYVRITAPNKRAAENLSEIKKALRTKGYRTPLVADIHFTPNAAEIAARIVEKVRVNPGNYADKKKFQMREYSDKDYESEIERIYKRFAPLVQICKEEGTAMRIGTNHGSLSDRIMSRYGDTPLGMLESAMEFVRICEDLQYYDIVLSMKASNPQVMVQAYRLLVQYMKQTDRNYPIHLGVTEAGDGEEGRVKSAIGIGTLLEDGIGDTIRVSLTEDAVAEVPVARKLAARYAKRPNVQKPIPEVKTLPFDPLDYTRRKTHKVHGFGGDYPPQVIADLRDADLDNLSLLKSIGYRYKGTPANGSANIEDWQMNDLAADAVYLGNRDFAFTPPEVLKRIYDYTYWKTLDDKANAFPCFDAETFVRGASRSEQLNLVRARRGDLTPELLQALEAESATVLVLSTNNAHALADLRRAFIVLMEAGLKTPVVLHRHHREQDEETLQLYSATDIGGLQLDGLGDGIWLQNAGSSLYSLNQLAFNILQAARTRISRTDYIACPSCGRTLFDLQEVTAKVRSKTSHLKGVKIAVMGCIVNGPGEMADADYGYVGSGPGKITLYKGKEVVKRKVEAEVAVDELVGLIKEDGNWRDPPEEV